MKRRKKIIAWACVGSHDLPFYCMVSTNEALEGRLEIFNTEKDAQRHALSSKHVRRCEIFIEREPL